MHGPFRCDVCGSNSDLCGILFPIPRSGTSCKFVGHVVAIHWHLNDTNAKERERREEQTKWIKNSFLYNSIPFVLFIRQLETINSVWRLYFLQMLLQSPVTGIFVAIKCDLLLQKKPMMLPKGQHHGWINEMAHHDSNNGTNPIEAYNFQIN